MSNIPKAREAILEFARNSNISPQQAMRLRNIVKLYMIRERPVRKAPKKNIGVTPYQKRRIKALFHSNPRMHQEEIGRIVGVNAGRVSEVLNGKR